jgi:hypothetical protein
MDEERRQHLEFIQNVVTRMNTNSFQIKGMTVAVVSALMAIYATTPNIILIFLGILPTILFWFLDSYYLQQERKFRGVYNDVTGLKNVVDVRQYDMPIHKYTKNVDRQYSFFNVFLSKTILSFYICIIIALLLIGLFMNYKSSFIH